MLRRKVKNTYAKEEGQNLTDAKKEGQELTDAKEEGQELTNAKEEGHIIIIIIILIIIRKSFSALMTGPIPHNKYKYSWDK
jgi:hypothetical protein